MSDYEYTQDALLKFYIGQGLQQDIAKLSALLSVVIFAQQCLVGDRLPKVSVESERSLTIQLPKHYSLQGRPLCFKI